MKCSGYYVATAGEYKLVKLWDLRTSKTFQILQLDPGYEVIYNTYFNYYQIIGFSWRTSASTPVAPTWLWWGLMWQCTSASSGRSWRWWGSTRLFLPGWDLESMPSTWPPPVWTEPWRSTHLRLLPWQAGEQSPARRPVNTNYRVIYCNAKWISEDFKWQMKGFGIQKFPWSSETDSFSTVILWFQV